MFFFVFIFWFLFCFLSVIGRCRQACYKWVCGDTKAAEIHITEEEREMLRLKMTSLHQNKKSTVLLNFTAAFLIIAITFLFGFYA